MNMKWNEAIQKMNEDAMKKLRKRKKVAYCPRNGCYMPNGAGPEVTLHCKCGESFKSSTHGKLCPKCHTCPCCHRIGKKFSK